MTRRALLLLCLLASSIGPPAVRAAEAELDLRSIPIAQWLSTADTSEIPWSIQVGTPGLRMDQRLEIPYSVRIGAKQLNRSGNAHDLFLVTRMSSPDGEWLNEASILHREVDKKLPGNTAVQFEMRAFVQPGDYLLWLVLYD